MLSKINPEKNDCTANIKNKTLTTRVGIFTTPLCKKSTNTGTKKHSPTTPSRKANSEKNAKGL